VNDKTFDQLEQKITAKKLELDELMAQFQKKLQAEFTDLTAAFFAETGIQAIVWNQYTPYFNDGDECTFSIGEIYFVISGFDREELGDAYDYEDDELYEIVPNYYSFRKGEVKHPLRDVCDKFIGIVNNNEGLFKDMFGDHMTVYLTPEESFAQEYDHE